MKINKSDEPETEVGTAIVMRRLPSGRIVEVTVPLYHQAGQHYKKQIDVYNAIVKIMFEDEEE